MNPDALLAQFDDELFAFLHRERPRSETFRRMVADHMDWRAWDDGRPTAPDARGKRVRPLLSLLTARAIGADHRAAIPAAIAVQLVHDFSIILDDIMDRDRTRRNRPALWVSHGTGHAMTAAAGIYVVGLDALQDYPDQGLTHTATRDLTRTLLESCLEMADAQHLDLDWEQRFDITLDEVRTVALGRSCLIRCGIELAAAVSTPDREIRAAFREFGALVATAFSIVDDHRGLWGSEERNGKPLHSDLRGHKKTYPVVAGQLACAPAERRRLRDLLAHPEPGDHETAEIMRLLDGADAAGATLREVERLRALAVERLRTPPLTRCAVADLVDLTRRLFATPAPATAPAPAPASAERRTPHGNAPSGQRR
ncbi:polyprenyl synthetase family protein [Streptomyces sp. NPDC005840]|uniref:polyprenyl synthetase family protein n=1 Tax=Streptomyces sp. NPDC005840 TaxID=3157072 RepID=UPI0033C0E7B7